MVKKIFLVFVFCLLLMSIITLNQFFMNLQYISTFKCYVTEQLKIPFSVINDYNSNDNELIKNASKEIILTTLENMGYEHWKEYIDYIELNIYKANVIPDSDKELIVALNMSKDLAAIGVYSAVDGQYIFKTALKDILPIKNITFLKVPEKEISFLVTEQLLDERFGAFFVDQFLEIFLFQSDSFTSVFKKSKYLQEIYKLMWISPDADPDQWIKIVEDNSFSIKQEPTLNIKVSILRKKMAASKYFMPEESEYTTVQEIITEENYYWNPNYSHFVINEGIDKNSNLKVAIIEDTSTWRESFLGLKSNNFMVKTLKGDVFFQEKKSIILK